MNINKGSVKLSGSNVPAEVIIPTGLDSVAIRDTNTVTSSAFSLTKYKKVALVVTNYLLASGVSVNLTVEILTSVGTQYKVGGAGGAGTQQTIVIPTDSAARRVFTGADLVLLNEIPLGEQLTITMKAGSAPTAGVAAIRLYCLPNC